jgi:hypothetical protein
MTERNIKSAFGGAGLVPLNAENVVSKLDMQQRTPTPVEEVASPSTPWVSISQRPQRPCLRLGLSLNILKDGS